MSAADEFERLAQAATFGPSPVGGTTEGDIQFISWCGENRDLILRALRREEALEPEDLTKIESYYNRAEGNALEKKANFDEFAEHIASSNEHFAVRDAFREGWKAARQYLREIH